MANLKILFCTPEMAPYAKTGGLADVVGALPQALQQLGCDVRVFMPLYRGVRDKFDGMDPVRPSSRYVPAGPVPGSGTQSVDDSLRLPLGHQDYRAFLWESRTPSGIPVYTLEKDEFYDRTYLYGTPTRGDYEDNAERFIAFCFAVRLLCMRLNWFPSIFHLHDWQTALVAAYHRLSWRHDPYFIRSGTVFTIHNLAYQGLFSAGTFGLMHLPSSAFAPEGMEFWGRCNVLKAGLVYSDFLTTVSPCYSKEIQLPEFGYGLEGVLQRRQDSLAGILNGIDTTVWNPESDPLIPEHFNASDLFGKRACKETLLAALGFPEEHADRPLLGMIGRLATQKGFDLLSAILEELMALPVCLVILGTGDAVIEEKLNAMAGRYPDRFKLLSQFNEELAHQIEAGADIFLMPSRYEPCGLNQMYSLRYGTIPVVHATGGLDDSVVDVRENPSEGTGFKFTEYVPAAFLEAIRSALELFRDRERWAELQRRAMTHDFSWGRSAGEYLEIYDRVLDKIHQAPSRIL